MTTTTKHVHKGIRYLDDPRIKAVFEAEQAHRKAMLESDRLTGPARLRAWDRTDRLYEAFIAAVHALAAQGRRSA